MDCFVENVIERRDFQKLKETKARNHPCQAVFKNAKHVQMPTMLHAPTKVLAGWNDQVRDQREPSQPNLRRFLLVGMIK